MNRCKTCKWWQADENRYNRTLYPWDEERCTELTEDEVAAQYGHRTRYCRHPKILFYQMPDLDGAAVFDGSEYSACLATAEDFGCVLHDAS